MIYPINHIRDVIRVGVQTEKGVEEIGFDMTPWLTRWPGMAFAVWVTRPGEAASYPAADTEMVGNVLYWHPNATDTEKEGAGHVEVVGIGDGKCKSTGVMDTLVKPTSLDVTQETPEPIRLWAEKVMQAADAVLDSVDAGSGALYLVSHGKGGLDRSMEQIVEAANGGKTVLLTYRNRVWTYNGLGTYRDNNGVDYSVPTFRVPMGYDATGLVYELLKITPAGLVSVYQNSGIKTPNPKALTIEQNGQTVTYDGSEAIKIKIAGGNGGGSIPDPGKAFQQLVSDADGKAVWQEQIAYKYFTTGMVDILKEVTLTSMGDDDGDGTDDVFASTTPLAAMPEAGKSYEVTINGTQYNSRAYDVGETAPGIVIGNPNKIDPSLEDTGEPYALCALSPEAQAAMGGATLLLVYSADSATLSIRGQATITTIKKIDKDLLPDTHKTITIMIDADGNVMCDTPFATAWAMTNGELQSALKIVQTGNYGGQPSELEADVQVRRRSTDMLGEALEITFRQYTDPGDAAAVRETTRYIYWAAGGLQLANFTLYSLPVMDHWGYDQQTYYLRSVRGVWQPVSIDQMKQELGIGGGVEPATTDTFYTADGQVFMTLEGAVMHVQKGEQNG